MLLESAGQMVVIASARSIGAVKAQLRTQPNARVFSESDFLLALKAIMSDLPKVIVLDPDFAATARGAALVARVKAEPKLSGAKIQALVRENMSATADQSTNSDNAAGRLEPLNKFGTRRAPRFAISPEAEARINGTRARLINLSVSGAQVVAPIRLRPSEVIRLVLIDQSAELRVAAVVAWATLEISSNDPEHCYRFGLEFRDTDPKSLQKFCARYRKDPSKAHAAVIDVQA